MDITQIYNSWDRQLTGFLNLQPVLTAIQKVADQVKPAPLIIAFVLLVFGTMRGFLNPEINKFFQTLLRAVILVALIAGAAPLEQLFDRAAQGLANWPVTAQVSAGSLQMNFTTGERPVITTLLQTLQRKAGPSGQGEQGGGQSQQSGLSLNPGDWLNGARKVMIDFGTNIVWQVLFAIYLLCLLCCKFIILIMDFLQQVLRMLFELYAPIAFAELSIVSLKHRANGFFLTYVGLLCWPVGWSFVNVVTLALFQTLPSPQTRDLSTLLVAIIASVPVLLWVFIGHVMCPFFAQKIVSRGGAAIQGAIGTIVGTIGGGAAAIYGDALKGAGANLKAISNAGSQESRHAQRTSGSDSGEASSSRKGERFGRGNFWDGFDEPGSGADGRDNPGGGLLGALRGVARMNGEALNQAGRAVSGTSNLAQFAGHEIGEASGESGGSSYRALRAFGLYRPQGRSSSSFRARQYIDGDGF